MTTNNYGFSGYNGNVYTYSAETPKDVFTVEVGHKDKRRTVTFSGGGGKNSWKEISGKPDIVICPQDQSMPNMPPGWKSAKFFPMFIGLDAPDFAAPNVPAEFWHAIREDIEANDIRRVHCQCVGGHGRTGTFLAIFIGMYSPNIKKLSELIATVREWYSPKAVESTAQLKYVAGVLGIEADLTGIKTKEEWKPAVTPKVSVGNRKLLEWDDFLVRVKLLAPDISTANIGRAYSDYRTMGDGKAEIGEKGFKKVLDIGFAVEKNDKEKPVTTDVIEVTDDSFFITNLPTTEADFLAAAFDAGIEITDDVNAWLEYKNNDCILVLGEDGLYEFPE